MGELIKGELFVLTWPKHGASPAFGTNLLKCHCQNIHILTSMDQTMICTQDKKIRSTASRPIRQKIIRVLG